MGTSIHHFDAGPWRASKGWHRVLEQALYKAFPRANPDLESNYEHVTYWWLEIDLNRVVTREIGFTSDGEAIAAAPLGENYGIFTDLNSAPDELGPVVDATTFEQVWVDVQRRFRAGIAGAGLR